MAAGWTEETRTLITVWGQVNVESELGGVQVNVESELGGVQRN